MSTQTAHSKTPGGIRVGVQKVGSFMSGMVMPNIPALVAWGLFTAFFIEKGWTPNADLSTIVGPMIHYLLPLLIAYTGGFMIHDKRGGVVGSIATMGAIAGSDLLISNANAALPAGADSLGQIHMFLGAMIMGPLAAWIMKKLDGVWEGKVKAGFEMLVNMFSAGIFGFLAAVFAFYVLAPIVNSITNVLSTGVAWLVENSLLPLTSILIEPAKVFFLNNAINHGVLTPLGIAEADTTGRSVLFLLEANPGVGLGLLLAFTFFGVGAAKGSAPGAAIIQFFGGIHEVYFPYVLMKPMLLIAVVAGGMSGVAVNMIFDTGLRAPAAPGSIIAVYLQATPEVMNYVGITLAVFISAAVTFVIAAIILRASRARDLAADDQFSAAVARTQANKGKGSSVLAGLAGAQTALTKTIERVVFACDAGMGSSAMGASVLRKKFADAGLVGLNVTNKSIANLDGTADLVITQSQLTDRARQNEPSAMHVSVGAFMNAPEYDDIVDMLRAQQSGDTPASPAEEVPDSAPAENVLRPEYVRIHAGAASRDEAIAEAAAILESAGAVTSAYAAAMVERENTVSTYMGNGLAIPHGTDAAKDAVLGSALSVVRYDGGADWGDGDTATFVVGIAGKGGAHLEILSAVAQQFSDDVAVAKLTAAKTPEELYELLSGTLN
ncbi:PTS mannitol transporter subunit IICBA [Microbacterium amylolyticum]|uniref:Mannitol-specific phosphotransferase enzyme IIA component n=1 Tax=Microbacterium amylolyticum TaxID=936337 RepID=A0ABS4ZJS3_9MICO|nr:PTS mannitol transporter subunit IICBA [Microbacterium amylolyticum]MBP2437539.1 PTS system mannitol-specific IIC component [Microbacterium amylolyticum]